MTEANTSLGRYERFSKNVYESMGLSTPIEEVRRIMGNLADTLYGQAEEREWFYDSDSYNKIRQEPWRVAHELEIPALKTVIALDSISIPTGHRWWPRLTLGRIKNEDPRVPLQLTQLPSGDLLRAAEETKDKPLILQVLGATASGVRDFGQGYIPSFFAEWPIGVSQMGEIDEIDIEEIIDNLNGMRFSDRPTDSEEMEEEHPVGYLLRPEIPEPIKLALLDVAKKDVDTTEYKPWVWKSQLKNTLLRLADTVNEPLRFRARKDLGLPIKDEDYKSFKINEKEMAAAEKARQYAGYKVANEAQKIIDDAKREEIREKIRKAFKTSGNA